VYSYIIILGVYNDKLQLFIMAIVTHYNEQLKHHSTYNEKRKGCANDIVFHSIIKCITVLYSSFKSAQ
jgi:hypothetical protein